MPGLNPEEAEQFILGQTLFNRAFTPEEGLGPLFNQARCSSCHDLPTSGGHGAEPVTKASHFDELTGCNLLREEGGDLLQASVVPALRAAGVLPERIPVSATAVTELRAPSLYGIGLVEVIDDDDILIEPTRTTWMVTGFLVDQGLDREVHSAASEVRLSILPSASLSKTRSVAKWVLLHQPIPLRRCRTGSRSRKELTRFQSQR